MKKFYSFCIFFACLLYAESSAQPSETVYQGTTIVSGFTNPISLTADGPFPIGFTFNFYGNDYTQFWVSENGRIMFTEPASAYSLPTATVPSATLPNNYIAPFWDNLAVDGTGNILYATIGAAPNRKLVVQYRNMIAYTSPAYFMGTFSVILYETTNKIQFQYRQIVDYTSARTHGSDAAIAIENSTGSEAAVYAFKNPTAIVPEQAILFTPGTPYTIDGNATYDGIYLTKSISTPEPGIVNLLSPPQDAVIGNDFTFTWSAATNTSSYTLLISENSGLSGSTPINAGLNTSYNVTGLESGKTYYWGVFSVNTTGTTWCDIKKFTVSSTPPLAAVPQTVWVEQTQSKQITLAYTGGDAGAKTAKITSLPAQGKLYQYNAGVKGAEITAPLPVTVTDANRNVIYEASGTSGNGVGNFKYLMNDATFGDTPEAQITVNVSPPGIPNVLYVAKGSNYVEIQFDIAMSDPAGKEAQFTVKSNGTTETITSAALKTGDNRTYILNTGTLTEPVTVAYTQGTITSAGGGVLLSFSDQAVTLTAQTISFTQALDLKYNNFPFTLTATASSTLPVSYASSNLGVTTVSGNTLNFVNLGSADITALQAGNTTYAPARFVRALTIAKADQAITFSLEAKTYGDPDFTMSATATSGLPVTYSSGNPTVASVVNNIVTINAAGSAVITASQAGNAYWNAATPVQQTLTVAKATLTVTADPKSKVYLAVVPALTFTYSGWVKGVETIDTPPTAVTTVTQSSPAGTYTGAITVSGGSDNNYSFSYVAGDFTVTKANQTILFLPLSNGEVGQPDFSPGATASSGLPVTYTSDNPAVAEITPGQLIHIVSKGTATILAHQLGDDNYYPAPTEVQSLVVDRQVKINVPKPNSTLISAWYANNLLYIKYPDEITATEGRLTIYEMNGRPAVSEMRVDITAGGIVNTGLSLAKGVYVCRITAGQFEYTFKLFVHQRDM